MSLDLVTTGRGSAAEQQRRVLVVDDEPGFRELLKRILEPAGYEVQTASDATSALERIAERPPAVAVCDIHMPGANGLWLANQIRVLAPTTAVVLATSDDTIPPVETFRKGVVAYVVKPWRTSAVLKAVAAGVEWFAAEAHQSVMPLIPVAATRSVDGPKPLTTTPAPSTTPRQHAGGGWTWMVTALVVIVIAFAGVGYQYRQSRPNRAYALAAASSGAVIVVDTSGKTISQGSGFFVAPDTFVTNHHVVSGGYAAHVVVGERTFAVTGLVGMSREHDLVLLKLADPSPTFLELNILLPSAGDDISVYGAPLGLRGTLSTGIVSAVRTTPQTVLQISAPISLGSSGSPVVDAQGKVVGVVSSSYLAEGQNLNFAVPAMYVRELMNAAGAVRPLIASTRGAENDLERHELIGPVRMATVFAPSPGVAGVKPALLDSKTSYIFDRSGRLLERTLGDDNTRTQYQYDDHGKAVTIVDRVGEKIINTWTFMPAGPRVLAASIGAPPAQSTYRIEDGDDGRLVGEDMRAGDRVVSSTRWSYDGQGWPLAVTTGSATPATVTAPSVTSVTPGTHEERDALGNLIHRTRGDGTEERFEYQFDPRGNWLTRTTIPVNGPAGQQGNRVEHRQIQYW